MVIPEGHASGLELLFVRKFKDFKKTESHLNNILLRSKLPLPKRLGKFQAARERMFRLQALEEQIINAANAAGKQVMPWSTPNMYLNVLPFRIALKQETGNCPHFTGGNTKV